MRRRLREVHKEAIKTLPPDTAPFPWVNSLMMAFLPHVLPGMMINPDVCVSPSSVAALLAIVPVCYKVFSQGQKS